jgi:hypothetical protein
LLWSITVGAIINILEIVGRIIIVVITIYNVTSFDVTPFMYKFVAAEQHVTTNESIRIVFLLLFVTASIILIVVIIVPLLHFIAIKFVGTPLDYRCKHTFPCTATLTTTVYSRFPATVDLFVALLDAFFAVILPPLDDFAAFPPLDFAIVAAQSAAEGVAVNCSVGGG